MTPSDTEVHVALGMEEAVALGAAWVQHAARVLNLRTLVIKGSPMSDLGLRAPRQSADVDVLVHPMGAHQLCGVLLRGGWAERQVPSINETFGRHARSFVHPNWPCDIDVHTHFPGFLAPAAHVFETLWLHRTTVAVAHQVVEIPDRAASLMILALHSLRDGNVKDLHQQDLEGLRLVQLSDLDRQEIAELLVATGSASTLGSMLACWSVRLNAQQLSAARANEQPGELARWRGRVAAKSTGAYAWSVAISNAGWRDVPRLAYRAIWPSNQELLLAHPGIRRQTAYLLLARARRLVRGVRGIPTAIRAHRDSRTAGEIKTSTSRR